MSKKSHNLCKLADLDDPSSKSFSVKIKRKTTDIFIIRKGENVFGYINICPHAQAPLEWNPDEFLDSNKKNIICALHGAQFTIEEGDCIDGPCAGIGLTAVELEIIDGEVFLQ